MKESQSYACLRQRDGFTPLNSRLPFNILFEIGKKGI